MESLRELYNQHEGRLLHKWDHFIDIYDLHFSKYRHTEFVFLEIGVAHGGSLELWRKYFGEKATIIGVDVNPECKKFEQGNTKVIIGSQEDENFLRSLKEQLPKIDVLLDDGGHTMKQQMITFRVLFDHVKENGLYVCEDLHTSYWPEYGGGYKRKSSFIEFSKTIIDKLHGWHAPRHQRSKMFSHLTESVYGLHYYDSILVIEKRSVKKPYTTFRGEEQLTNMPQYKAYGTQKVFTKTVRKWIKKIIR
ncbi:MAG TPA: class I SAM-dependent methyltransferase [Niastella sp.]